MKESSRPMTVLWWTASLAALSCGVLLRTVGLAGQVQGGDEIHAAQAALGLSLSDILVTYLPNDNSIPLTALFRALMDAGLVLNEMLMRLPALVTGLVFLGLAPLAVRRRLGVGIASNFLWLVALSPGLVMYSRIVRSYMPTTLLACIAVWSFTEWWRTRRTRYSLLYATSAALAAWFHLGSAVFVAAPLAYAAVAVLVSSGPARRRDGMALLATAAGLAACVFLFAWPARHSLAAWPRLERYDFDLRMSVFGEVAGLEAGTSHWPVVLCFWALAALGTWKLWREHRSLAACLLTVQGCHAAAILALSPRAGLTDPMILNRYLLFGLPIVLLFVATGLHSCGRWLGGHFGANVAWVPLAGLVVASLPGGPWLRDGYWRSSFMHHNDYFRFTYRGSVQSDVVLPTPYMQLDENDGRPILELPWQYSWHTISRYAAYQRLHQRPVKVVTLDDKLHRGSIHWRNTLLFDPASLLATNARYLVLHRKLRQEEEDDGSRSPQWRRNHAELVRVANVAYRRLLAEWGSPRLKNAIVCVWDLDQVRTHQNASGP